MTKAYKLSDFLTEYSERNTENKYKPVAVGRYGIRKREEIYSKDLAKDYSKNKVIRENTLTVGMGSTQIDIGILIDDEIYSVSPAYHTYKIAGINCKYLGYYLSAKNHEMFARYVKRGSRQGKSIDLKRWLAYEMSVHDNDVQKEIVRNLGRIEAVIRQKEAELQKFDDLIKAQFVEMFGMPGANVKGWGLINLGDCVEINPKKSNDKRLVPGLEVSFVPMPAVDERGEINPGETRIYDKVKSGFTYFAENDVLFAKITPCMENGKGCVAKGLKNQIGFGSTEFHVLRPIKNTSNPYWIYSLTSFKEFREDAESHMSGSAGQKRVPASFLQKYRVSLPPIDQQNQFANFVSQVDKSKFAVQKSLEKTQQLFDSLMQEYFG